jgi:hypothetical protein
MGHTEISPTIGKKSSGTFDRVDEIKVGLAKVGWHFVQIL